MDIGKLMVDSEIPLQYIVNQVANATDGRYGGTRLNMEQVQKIVEAEYVLNTDKELANRLLEESMELQQQQEDGLLLAEGDENMNETDDKAESDDDDGIDTAEEVGDSTTTDDEEPK